MELTDSQDVVQREEQGIEIPIRDQFRKPALAADGTPAMMRVAGSYSRHYRDGLEAFQAWVVEESATLDEGDAIPQARRDAKWIELVLAPCILSWSGLTNGGEPFLCTRENAVVLLTPRPWIRDDVEAAIRKHEAFFGERSERSRAA